MSPTTYIPDAVSLGTGLLLYALTVSVFVYRVADMSQDYFGVRLDAETGPLGTRDFGRRLQHPGMARRACSDAKHRRQLTAQGWCAFTTPPAHGRSRPAGGCASGRCASHWLQWDGNRHSLQSSPVRLQALCALKPVPRRRHEP